MPGAHQRPRIHPAHRQRAIHRVVPPQPEVQRLPRDPGPDLRPSLRTGLPAGAAGRRARGDLPAEAGGRRSQGRHPALPAGHSRREEREAHRVHRRRGRLAHRRKRPDAAGVRSHDPREAGSARRPDVDEHPRVPASGQGPLGRDQVHHGHGGGPAPEQPRRQPGRPPGRGLRTPSSSGRGPPRGRS